MISAGELIYSQPRSAVQTGSPSQQTYRKRASFFDRKWAWSRKIFRGLRARNFMKPFKNPTSATEGGIWLSIPGYFDKGGGHMAVHRRIIPGWPSYLRIPGYLDKGGGGIWLSILG